MTFLIVISIIAVAVMCISQFINRDPRRRNADIDVQHMDNLSPEKQEEALAVSQFVGSRYITNEDIRKHLIHKVGEAFLAMPGWDIWDPSIHEAVGQYDRLVRSRDKRISVVCYDPRYKLARIKGKTAIYLTSCNRCSCPDYRERRLPCKHMYALARELDGDISKRIQNRRRGVLDGMTFALAGRFGGGRDGKDGIRARISKRKGQWQDHLAYYCTALVTGAVPSAAKIEMAHQYDIEILTEDVLDNLFVYSEGDAGPSKDPLESDNSDGQE